MEGKDLSLLPALVKESGINLVALGDSVAAAGNLEPRRAGLRQRVPAGRSGKLRRRALHHSRSRGTGEGFSGGYQLGSHWQQGFGVGSIGVGETRPPAVPDDQGIRRGRAGRMVGRPSCNSPDLKSTRARSVQAQPGVGAGVRLIPGAPEERDALHGRLRHVRPKLPALLALQDSQRGRHPQGADRTAEKAQCGPDGGRYYRATSTARGGASRIPGSSR